MGSNSRDMNRKSSIRTILLRKECLLFFLLLLPMFTKAQYNKVYADITANMLVDMGFENVVWSGDEEERVYVLENTPWRLQGVGLANAIDRIQKTGLPEKGKSCRIVVLDNNIPQISLIYTANPDSLKATPGSYAARSAWDATYDLGDSWDKVKKEYRVNSSLFKVDVVVYPELYLKNLVITQIYQVLFNLLPTIEVSFWNGMKLTAQMMFPIFNDGYGKRMDKIHPGTIALSQSFRLPMRTFARVSVGLFDSDRYGIDLKAVHYFKDERFSAEGRIGCTGTGYWNGDEFHYGKHQRVTWSLGGSFYWPKYNTQISLKAEQYLLHEVGGRIDLIRHFRYCSIGFYAMKAQGALKNGGFRFQVALPPYKYKRKYARVTTSDNRGMSYNAGNERYYYKNYYALPEDNMMKQNQFTPYFIKSELLNF